MQEKVGKTIFEKPNSVGGSFRIVRALGWKTEQNGYSSVLGRAQEACVRMLDQ